LSISACCSALLKLDSSVIKDYRGYRRCGSPRSGRPRGSEKAGLRLRAGVASSSLVGSLRRACALSLRDCQPVLLLLSQPLDQSIDTCVRCLLYLPHDPPTGRLLLPASEQDGDKPGREPDRVVGRVQRRISLRSLGEQSVQRLRARGVFRRRTPSRAGSVATACPQTDPVEARP
jgi:hypothetical protein